MKYQFDKVEHVHSLDGSPLMGTSTVIKEVLPPFLAKWGAQMGADFTLAEVAKTTYGSLSACIDDLQKRILPASVNAWTKARSDAAKGGTDMHSALENYVVDCLNQNEGKPIALSMDDPVVPEENKEKMVKFATWSVKYIDKFVFSEKNTYSKELWVGGQVDCLAKLKTGMLVVVDFKSSPKAYFNQFIQCAGYAAQLEESGYGDADGANWTQLEQPVGGLLIIPFGGKTLKPELIENVNGYKDVFARLVEVYKYQMSFKENGTVVLAD